MTAHSPAAIAAYPMPSSATLSGRWMTESLRAAFDAGRAYVTPAATREALLLALQRSLGCERRAHYGNVENPFCGKHGRIGQWPCPVFAGVADALLAPGGPIQQVEAPDTNGEQA